MTRTATAETSQIKEMTQGDEGKVGPSALQGQLLQRKRLRKVDLSTLRGTTRAHAQIVRKVLRAGTAGKHEDSVSRILGRHSLMIGELEQQEVVEQLRRDLETIKSRQLAAFVDPAYGDGPGEAIIPDGAHVDGDQGDAADGVAT